MSKKADTYACADLEFSFMGSVCVGGGGATLFYYVIENRETTGSGRQRGLGFCVVYSVINAFYRGAYAPPSRSNWTQGTNCFSRA